MIGLSIDKFKKIELHIEFFCFCDIMWIRKEDINVSDDLQKKNEDSQRKIFSKNLKRYIGLNNKSQIDICKDLGINPTTFNMWCTGKSIPGVGKISKLADYFGIGITDLTEEKRFIDVDAEYADATVNIQLNDERFKKIVIACCNLPKNQRQLICDFFEMFII